MKVYGLSNYLRVSIGTEVENIKFIDELKTFLKNEDEIKNLKKFLLLV